MRPADDVPLAFAGSTRLASTGFASIGGPRSATDAVDAAYELRLNTFESALGIGAHRISPAA